MIDTWIYVLAVIGGWFVLSLIAAAIIAVVKRGGE